MNSHEVEPRRADLRAIPLLKESFEWVKSDYWILLGVTTVGVLIASVVPLGILLGPMFCGIHLCYKAKSEGEPVVFNGLFKGFDVFVESLVVAMLMVVVLLAVLVPFALLALLGAIVFHEEFERDLGLYLAAFYGVFYPLIFVVSLLLHAVFMYAFPLIADRRMKGLDAMKASARAFRANMGGTLRLVFLSGLLGLIGAVCCCVGTRSWSRSAKRSMSRTVNTRTVSACVKRLALP